MGNSIYRLFHIFVGILLFSSVRASGFQPVATVPAAEVFQLDETITEVMEARINRWLEKLLQTESGTEMIQTILNANHPVTLVHNYSSLISAGKTLSPLSSKIFNGIGDEAEIQMAFDMPEEGSHKIEDCDGDLRKWPAIVNFFHELSHARHTVKGTMEYRSEYQAIQDENVFHQELMVQEDRPAFRRCHFNYGEDERTFFPQHRH